MDTKEYAKAAGEFTRATEKLDACVTMMQDGDHSHRLTGAWSILEDLVRDVRKAGERMDAAVRDTAATA